MKVKHFKGFADLPIAADTYDEDDSPSVLIIPGGWQKRSEWASVAEPLAEAGRHVVCVDLRGHGDSGWSTDGRYDLDVFVEDLYAVLRQLPSRAVILAASLGGWIAIPALGEGGPDLAAALVLVDAPPSMDQHEAAQVGSQLYRRAKENPAFAFDIKMIGSMEPVQTEVRLLQSASWTKLPTLIIRGALSHLSSTQAVQDLTQSIAGAEVLQIEEAGHLVATDRVDAFNAALLEFLERRVPLQSPEYKAGSDLRTLRDALGCFGTGITVVTALSETGVPVGLTANSLTSVSLDPPLLLVFLANSVNSLSVFENTIGFAVNVLHIGQQPVSARFASREEDCFAATPWEQWTTGAPIILARSRASNASRTPFMREATIRLLLGRSYEYGTSHEEIPSSISEASIAGCILLRSCNETL